jgi:hypothetical protein
VSFCIGRSFRVSRSDRRRGPNSSVDLGLQARERDAAFRVAAQADLTAQSRDIPHEKIVEEVIDLLIASNASGGSLDESE